LHHQAQKLFVYDADGDPAYVECRVLQDVDAACDFDVNAAFLKEMHVWDLTLSEVVRQAHVHCAERGVLLERLRLRVAFLVKALGSHFQSLQKVLQNVASKLKQVSAACEAAQSGQLVDVQAAESESEEEDLVDIEDVHEDGHFDQDIQEFGLQVRDEMEGELRVDGKKRKVGLNELLTKNGIRGALSMMCISGPRTIGTQTSKVFRANTLAFLETHQRPVLFYRSLYTRGSSRVKVLHHVKCAKQTSICCLCAGVARKPNKQN